MNNLSNRRMFMRPVMAAEGVYMPTIEQILNFYMGEFTDDGRPKDMKAFEEAIETARKAEAAGLFPGEGKPIDNYLYFGQDQKDFVKETGKDLQQPTFGYFEQGKPTDEMRDYLADLYTIPARKEAAETRIQSDKTKAEADAMKDSFLDAMEATKDFDASKVKDPTPDALKRGDLEFQIKESEQITPGLPNVEGNPYLKELEKLQRTSGANVDMPMVDQYKAYQSGKAGIPAVELGEKEVAAINARNYMRELSDKFGDMDPAEVEKILIGADASDKGLKTINTPFKDDGSLINIMRKDEVEGAGVTSTPGYENFATDLLNRYYQQNPNVVPNITGDQSTGDFFFNLDKSKRLDSVERDGEPGEFKITDDGAIVRTGIEQVSDDVVDTTPGDIKRGDLEFEIKDSEKITDDDKVKEQVEELDELGFFEKPENIKKFDVDGDGKLSFLEKANALAGEITGDKVDIPLKKSTENIQKILEEGGAKEDVQVGMSQEDLEEDKKRLEDADLKDGADTKDNDDKGLSTAGESSTTSTGEGNEMNAFENEISKVAKEAGFNWSDMVGDGSSKDNDALEMMMYGLKLATTPGSFNDAVMQNAKEYLNNKIKRNYKTAAAKADLKKQIFLKYLQGNIDLKKWNAKQDYEAKNKMYNESKFYSNNEMDGMIADWAMGNFKLNLEGAEPGTAEYGLVLAMKDEITKIASEYKKDGQPPPRNITQMAYDRIDDDFNITKGKDGTWFAIPFFGNFFDKPGTVERTQSSSGNLVVTVSDFEQIKEKYKDNPNLTEEVLIAALKDQGYDTSLIE